MFMIDNFYLMPQKKIQQKKNQSRHINITSTEKLQNVVCRQHQKIRPDQKIIRGYKNSSINLNQSHSIIHDKEKRSFDSKKELQDSQFRSSAILGSQKDELKSFKNVDQQIEQTIKSMNDIAMRKRESDEEIKGKEFQCSIIKELNNKKDQLIKQITQNYRKIYQFLKDAEQKTYTDLVRAFRAIDGEMNRLNSQKSSVQKQYKKWWSDCKHFASQIKQTNQIQQKVKIFNENDLSKFSSQASIHIEKIEDKNQEIKESLFHMIHNIKLEFDPSIEKHIYNYAFVKTKFSNINSDVLKKKQVYMVRSLQFEDQNKSRGGERGFLSPGNKIQTNLKSTKTLPKKFLQKKTGSVRMIPKFENLEQIKHGENLEFAERMLNDFLTSKNNLDLTGCSLTDSEIFYLIEKASQKKQICSLNLSKNKLTNTGFLHLVSFLIQTTSINLSYNMLTEDILDELLNQKEILQKLRIVNLTHNRILNERRAKNKVEDLKKLGIIVTL